LYVERGIQPLRVLCIDDSITSSLRSRIAQAGCDTELSHIKGLFAVDVPPPVSLSLTESLIAAAGDVECEEANIASVHEQN
jgi:hypothetical protein